MEDYKGMATIDLDEWEWYEQFDAALTNTIAAALQYACAEMERMKNCGNCGLTPEASDECDDCTWDNSQWRRRDTP